MLYIAAGRPLESEFGPAEMRPQTFFRCPVELRKNAREGCRRGLPVRRRSDEVGGAPFAGHRLLR